MQHVFSIVPAITPATRRGADLYVAPGEFLRSPYQIARYPGEQYELLVKGLRHGRSTWAELLEQLPAWLPEWSGRRACVINREGKVLGQFGEDWQQLGQAPNAPPQPQPQPQPPKEEPKPEERGLAIVKATPIFFPVEEQDFSFRKRSDDKVEITLHRFTPVFATTSGRVSTTFNLLDPGFRLELHHDLERNLTTKLDPLNSGARQARRVGAGALLGESREAVLLWSIFDSSKGNFGQFIDPLQWAKERGARFPRKLYPSQGLVLGGVAAGLGVLWLWRWKKGRRR